MTAERKAPAAQAVTISGIGIESEGESLLRCRVTESAGTVAQKTSSFHRWPRPDLKRSVSAAYLSHAPINESTRRSVSPPLPILPYMSCLSSSPGRFAMRYLNLIYCFTSGKSYTRRLIHGAATQS